MKTKNTHTTKNIVLRVAIVFSVAIVFFTLGAIALEKLYNASDASVSFYSKVVKIQEEAKQDGMDFVSYEIQEALLDGKLSKGEYRTINQMYYAYKLSAGVDNQQKP